jgi:hypothetical protein
VGENYNFQKIFPPPGINIVFRPKYRPLIFFEENCSAAYMRSATADEIERSNHETAPSVTDIRTRRFVEDSNMK